MRRSLLSASLIASLALPALLLFLPGWSPKVSSHRTSRFRHLRAAFDDDEIHVGSLLVADRELTDPNFYQTAILIAKYDQEGTLGVIVNRQTDVPISRALDKWKEAKGRIEPVFIGGPVEKSAVLALVRSRGPFAHAVKLGRDLLLITDRAELQKLLATPVASTPVRIYFGYAGWGPDQLEGEIEEGAWHIFPHDPSLIFDSEPDTLWPRLIKKTETQIASLSR